MEEYSNNGLLNLFCTHGKCGRIVRRTCRTFNERYPNLPAMTPGKFARIEVRFIETGSIKTTQNYPKLTVDNQENEVNVLVYFQAYPQSSIPAAETDLGISRASIHRILAKHEMHPYSEITVHGLHPGDEARRGEFCEFI